MISAVLPTTQTETLSSQMRKGFGCAITRTRDKFRWQLRREKTKLQKETYTAKLDFVHPYYNHPLAILLVKAATLIRKHPSRPEETTSE